MTADHPLREFEFNEITRQLIVPQLTVLLPLAPKRVGDAWPIALAAAQCLVGEVPDPNDFELTGTLIEVRKEGSGPSLTAVIGIEGKMNLSFGLSSLGAKIQFVFDPPPATAPPLPATAKGDADVPKRRGQRDAEVVDARGKITRVIMRWAAVDVVPGSDGRLKQTGNYELNLARRLMPAANDAAGGQSAPLTVPDPLPAPNEANSWLVYEDPLQRFNFRHPQELVYGGSADPNSVMLNEKNPKGDVILSVDLQAKDAGRQLLDPDYHRRKLATEWEREKKDVLKGSTGWLPDADWSNLKRKVYRIEAALIPKGNTPANADRLYLDYYLVLFTSGESMVVIAMTEQDFEYQAPGGCRGDHQDVRFWQVGRPAQNSCGDSDFRFANQVIGAWLNGTWRYGRRPRPPAGRWQPAVSDWPGDCDRPSLAGRTRAETASMPYP